MGRWAQARKRGGCADGGLHLPLPPAPTLTLAGTVGTQTANGDDDTGGQVRLYSSTTGSAPWVEVDTDAWADPYDWGDLQLPATMWYRATEIGNNVAYAGESPPSEAVQVTGSE